MSDTPKVWLITGCSSGLGLALAREALRRGQLVTVTSRDPDVLGEFAGHSNSLVLRLDVTSPASVASAVAAAHHHWGRIDVLVNNAGSALLGAVEECSDAECRQNMETNFFGPLQLIRAVLPDMRRQRSGMIVNISAAAAVSSYPGFGVYAAGKAALDLLSDSLRAECAPLGIAVAVVHPGPFRTGFITQSVHPAEEKLPDYAASSGKFAALLGSIDGRQPGDPARAAAVIADMVMSGEMPPSLPLGRYMVKKLRDRAAALGKTADRWEGIAAGAEFGG